MRYVNSGNGKMPLISLIAILSISLCINMPGLAVSPMLSKLRHLFDASELEAQMLTSLPNLVMFPVVIIAGRLATPKWQTAVLAWGLSIFFVAGFVSLFAESMGLLIFLGCMVGLGCGLVVPIAAGAISEWFMRKPRQEDLGLKSTTSNAMVIIANIFVGIIVAVNWHAAFAVYLVPIVPLLLLPFMTQKYILKNRRDDTPAKEPVVKPAPQPGESKVHKVEDDVKFHAKKVAVKIEKDMDLGQTGAPVYHFQGKASFRLLVSIILLYVLLTYATTSISYYAPFVMDKYGMSTTEVGVVTAAYYLMVSVAGAVVGTVKRWCGTRTVLVCLAVCAATLIVIGFTKSFILMCIMSLACGFAYGVIQPIIYNKTTYIAPTRKAGMDYFGYVLSSNYVAIMMVPFVDSFFRKLFRSQAVGFDFIFSGCVVILVLLWAIWARKDYVFSVSPTTAAPSPEQIAASAGTPSKTSNTSTK